MNKDIIVPDFNGKVSWKIIKTTYELDNVNSTRMCPKITPSHVFPTKWDKMRVCYATQIFSHTFSSAIKTLIQAGKFTCNDDALATANFIAKVNNLFDCLNSRSLYSSSPHKSALQKNNTVYNFLKEMVAYFKEISIKLKEGKNQVYCVDGMVQTIIAVLLLVDTVTDEPNIFFIMTSRLNQDPLENFNGQIRARVPTNNNPTLYEFNHIVAKLMTIKLIQCNSKSTNCEVDEDTYLNNLDDTMQIIVSNSDQQTENYITINEANIENSFDYNLNCDIHIEKSSENIIEENSLKYVCGFIIFAIIKKIKCDSCVNIIAKENENITSDSEWFIFNKNYNGFSLKVPSDHFFNICKLHLKIFESFFKNYSSTPKIICKIEEICTNETNKIDEFKDWFSDQNICQAHHKIILKYFILILLRKHCTWLHETIVKTQKENKISKRKTNILMNN